MKGKRWSHDAPRRDQPIGGAKPIVHSLRSWRDCRTLGITCKGRLKMIGREAAAPRAPCLVHAVVVQHPHSAAPAGDTIAPRYLAIASRAQWATTRQNK